MCETQGGLGLRPRRTTKGAQRGRVNKVIGKSGVEIAGQCTVTTREWEILLPDDEGRREEIGQERARGHGCRSLLPRASS